MDNAAVLSKETSIDLIYVTAFWQKYEDFSKNYNYSMITIYNFLTLTDKQGCQLLFVKIQDISSGIGSVGKY